MSKRTITGKGVHDSLGLLITIEPCVPDARSLYCIINSKLQATGVLIMTAVFNKTRQRLKKRATQIKQNRGKTNWAISSLTRGPWSAASTWAGHRVPADGDRVLIRNGHRILYDV